MYDSLENEYKSITSVIKIKDLPQMNKVPNKAIFLPVASALLSLITSDISFDQHILLNKTNYEYTNKHILMIESYPEIKDFTFDSAPLMIPHIQKINVKIGQVKKLQFKLVEDENGFV